MHEVTDLLSTILGSIWAGRSPASNLNNRVVGNTSKKLNVGRSTIQASFCWRTVVEHRRMQQLKFKTIKIEIPRVNRFWTLFLETVSAGQVVRLHCLDLWTTISLRLSLYWVRAVVNDVLVSDGDFWSPSECRRTHHYSNTVLSLVCFPPEGLPLLQACIYIFAF